MYRILVGKTLGGPESWESGSKIYFKKLVTLSVVDLLWAHPTSYPVDTGDSFSWGITQIEREAIPAAAPIRFHGMIIKHRESSTFI